MDLTAAYKEIKIRGWGFCSGGVGFGDPSSSWTAVGPWKDGIEGGLVEVWGFHKDPVKAVEMALLKEITVNGY